MCCLIWVPNSRAGYWISIIKDIGASFWLLANNQKLASSRFKPLTNGWMKHRQSIYWHFTSTGKLNKNMNRDFLIFTDGKLICRLFVFPTHCLQARPPYAPANKCWNFLWALYGRQNMWNFLFYFFVVPHFL